jgi:hypothetical protein
VTNCLILFAFYLRGRLLLDCNASNLFSWAAYHHALLYFGLKLILVLKIRDLRLSVCGLSSGNFFLKIGLLRGLYLFVITLVPGFGVLVLLITSDIYTWIDLLFLLWLVFFSFSLLWGSSSAWLILLLVVGRDGQLVVWLGGVLSDCRWLVIRWLDVLVDFLGSCSLVVRFTIGRNLTLLLLVLLCLQGRKSLLLLLLALKHFHLLHFLYAEPKRPIILHELVLEVHALQTGLNVLTVPFWLKRNLHLLVGDNLYFWESVFWIQKLESWIRRFLAQEHVELSIFETPNINLLVYLLVECLQLKAKVGWAFSFDETIAVVVDLSLDLKTNIRSRFLSSLSECCKVVISNLVLIPPEQSNEWTIGSKFSLSLPAMVVDLTHCFIGYSIAHILWSPLFE